MQEKWKDFMEEVPIINGYAICGSASEWDKQERVKAELFAPAVSVSHQHCLPEIEIEL